MADPVAHAGKKPWGQILIAKVTERLLEPAFVARWAYRCGLQGELRVTAHSVVSQSQAVLARPLRIAFASDFHAGAKTSPEIFSRLFQHVRESNADVLLLGGDYIDARSDRISVLIESGLQQCRPPLGIFAVLGNHDHWSGAELVTRLLTEAGVHVLVNRSVPLEPPFGNVRICGIDDPWMGARDIRTAFAQTTGAIKIFLAHSPDGLLLLEDEHFDVAFAGHTHGGQVTFPSGTPIITAGGPLARRYSRGRFEIPGKGTLFVSRGVGCSTLPVRINSDPELIVCTLHP
jgi:predicted MPP superfamily phosphohydrolase